MAGDPGPRALPGMGPDLLADRVLFVAGAIDDARATELAAALLTLDALGEAPVTLRLTGATCSLATSLLLVDVLDELAAPVCGEAYGAVGGGAVLALAATSRRFVAPHATLHLAYPEITAHGTARELERTVALQQATKDAFLDALARCCGRPRDDVAEEWQRGAVLTAHDAVALGYADA